MRAPYNLLPAQSQYVSTILQRFVPNAVGKGCHRWPIQQEQQDRGYRAFVFRVACGVDETTTVGVQSNRLVACRSGRVVA